MAGIILDGAREDPWRLVRFHGAVIGRVNAEPGGDLAYYHGPFNVTHASFRRASIDEVLVELRLLCETG